MSIAPSQGVSVDELYADEYARAFDDFVRHMKRQGFPLSERLMEAAHERASERASSAARARGYRATDFRPMAKAGLAKLRYKYGY
jgi:hypothetical protein